MFCHYTACSLQSQEILGKVMVNTNNLKLKKILLNAFIIHLSTMW